MHKLMRVVTGLGIKERHVLEKMVGRSLAENEIPVIEVVTPEPEQTQSKEVTKSQEQSGWRDVYAGLSDKEIAVIEFFRHRHS